MKLNVRFLSSLEKVFCEPELKSEPLTHLTALRGETLSFQIALKSERGSAPVWDVLETGIPEYQIREAAVVPCLMPVVREDPYTLRTTAGLYPDPLVPLSGRIRLTPGNWHSLWVTLRIPSDFIPGDCQFRIRFRNDTELYWGEFEDENSDYTLPIEILSPVLPEQTLYNINWFYADCLSEYYRTPCWSERHWELLETYFRNMRAHGITHLLTPLWSVPLDTAVGGERPTAQLLGISWKEGKYSFDFSLLKRWIDTARRSGFEHLEMSHAFTQWGAEATPKIIVNGEKRFGWHVRADSAEYRDFLEQLFPELLEFLRKEGLEGKCLFHVSDEPSETQLESYAYASNLLRRLLQGKYAVIDALSHVDFFRKGLVSTPVPVTNALDEFMKEEKIPERWVYYCGNWEDGVPNRQFGMPSARNRILGVLLFVYDLDGFLNWGYNFWFRSFSRGLLDPWKETEAGRSFRGGGSFNVYPGEDGPVDSIHYEVFYEALQDLRALRALEKKIGREEVLRILTEGLSEPLSMRHYPRSASWILETREKINRRLAME